MSKNLLEERGVEFLRSQPIPKIEIEGMECLSWMIGHFRTQQVNLIVAETGFGKSDLMIDLAVRMAKNGSKVLFFSSEMTLQAVMPRFIANAQKITRTEAEKLNEEYLKSDEYDQKAYEVTVREQLKDANLRLEFDRDFSTIQSKIKQYKEQFDIQFVFVDHMLFLENDPNQTNKVFQNDADRLDYFHAQFHLTSQTENVCFVCATQFNKEGERGQEYGKRTKGDVAGGRAIGHVVENILYVFESEDDSKWNNEKSNQAWKTGYKTKIKTLKKRNGEGGEVNFKYYKSNCRFFEIPSQKPDRSL